MLNPIDSSQVSLVHWQAKEPFFGTGWSDVQSADWKSGPPHRWAVRTQDPTILLAVKKKARYLVTVEVFRFAMAEQLPGFRVLVNGKSVRLLGPAKTEMSGPGGGIFAAQLGRQRSESCLLTFHVDLLKSFNDANPEDPDQTPLGLALASITLVQLDDPASRKKPVAQT
jgi:hypothetical protein